MTKISILGSHGRMGKMIASELASGAHPAALALAVDRGDDKAAAFAAGDVLIDFTSPAALAEHAALAAQTGKPLVVGTTGLGIAEENALVALSKKVPVFYSANMSVGVNLLLSLVEQAAAKLGPEFDIEIFEAHHRNKADAPSGTAIGLGRAAARGRGVKLEEARVSHMPSTGLPRITGAIGFSVSRGGDIVGDHKVTFAGQGERVEISHKAGDRAIFAKGAIKAAVWLKGKPAGLYSMLDVLGL